MQIYGYKGQVRTFATSFYYFYTYSILVCHNPFEGDAAFRLFGQPEFIISFLRNLQGTSKFFATITSEGFVLSLFAYLPEVDRGPDLKMLLIPKGVNP